MPILCVWLLKHRGPHAERPGLFDRFQGAFARVVGFTVRWRWAVVPGYVAACVAVLGLVGTRVGQELFPRVDSGQFVLRFRPPPGTTFEITRQMAVRVLEVIQDEARLEALRRTSLLDSPPEEAFDRLTRIATTVLRVPAALVSLVDRDRLFFKSQSGLPEPFASLRKGPVQHSFCQHAVRTRETLVVPDSRRNPAFERYPAISGLGRSPTPGSRPSHPRDTPWGLSASSTSGRANGRRRRSASFGFSRRAR